MMNSQVRAMIVAAAALMGCMHAYAGNKNKVVNPENEGNYNFRCVGPTLDLQVSSFTLPYSRSAGSAATGSGAGRSTTSAITIEFPAGKAYAILYSQILHGDHYSSCTLVEKVEGSVFTWTFSQVTPTVVTAIWKDGSEAVNVATAGANLPAALARATLSFNEVRFTDGNGNSSIGAVDSWTATP
ncbi:MAG: hypothetical protein WAN35_17210 [Terracidiphilus sp.]